MEEILRLASSESRSQANGESTDTNGAEAPQGPSTEDRLKNLDKIGRSTSVDAILRRATSEEAASMGLGRLSFTNEPAGTSSNQAEDSIQNNSSTPPTYVGRLIGTVTATADLHQMGYGRFADFLNKNGTEVSQAASARDSNQDDSSPSDAALRRPTPEEAEAMWLNQLSHSAEPPNVSNIQSQNNTLSTANEEVASGLLEQVTGEIDIRDL